MSRALELRTELETLLAEALGRYLLPDGSEEAACWVGPQPVPEAYEVVPGSGVEAIINPPQLCYTHVSGKVVETEKWRIFLFQHNRAETLQSAIALICHHWRCEKPVQRDQMEIEGGIEPEQARIDIIFE